jgi:hypothetical protein
MEIQQLYSMLLLSGALPKRSYSNKGQTFKQDVRVKFIKYRMHQNRI